MFARIRTARPELESQHRYSHGPAGQGDRRQHARRALFRTGDAPEAELDSPALSQRLVASGDFTPASALAFLVFILLYLPCIATIVAIAAEIGWRWACISVLYNTVLAWIMAYLTYHLFSWL